MKTLVICPQQGIYSETFIRQHIEMLPGEVSVLHNILEPRLDKESYEEQNQFYRLFLRLFQNSDEIWKSYTHQLRKRLVQRVHPNVLLLEYGTTAAEMVEDLAAWKIPYVVHFHGYDASEFSILERYAQQYQQLFREAGGLVVVSQAMKRKLLELGASEEKIVYCPCGVPKEFFPCAHPEQSSPQFLAIGRFVEKKAPHLTILAFAEVLKKIPEARLTLIGDGPLLDACITLVQALKISTCVIFKKALSHEEVQQEMLRSRCFVQHSVQAPNGNCEGTPVSISEAMMSGLPVVSTYHAGIPDIISHEKTGFLVEEGDLAGMAYWMMRLAEEPLLAQRIGTAAHAYAMEYLTAERNIGILADLLKKVAKKGEV